MSKSFWCKGEIFYVFSGVTGFRVLDILLTFVLIFSSVPPVQYRDVCVCVFFDIFLLLLRSVSSSLNVRMNQQLEDDFKLSPCSLYCMLFCVIPRRLEFICRRFGTLCLFHLHRWMEQTECSESWAYKLQTPGNYPKKSIQQIRRRSEISVSSLCNVAEHSMTSENQNLCVFLFWNLTK